MVRYTIGKPGNEKNHEDNTDPAESSEKKETKGATEEVEELANKNATVEVEELENKNATTDVEELENKNATVKVTELENKNPTMEVKELENKNTTEATKSPGNRDAEKKANKQDDTSKSPENKGEQNKSVDEGGSSKLKEYSDNQLKEKTSEMKPRGEEDVEMDRMSRFEKQLLICRNRQIEIESKTTLLEERLDKSLEVMMRKIDSVLEFQQRSLPPPAPANSAAPRWAFPAPLTLLQVSERGDTEALLRLLSAEGKSWEAQLQQRDAHGDTALHLAAARGHARVAQLLLMVGASASTPGRRLRTPLHCAAANGHLQIVRRLLNAGVAVDDKDSNGATALAAAAMSGRMQVVSILLKNGARPDVVDEKGLSPIFLASSGGHTNVVRLLLDNGVSTDVEGKTLLAHAAKAGQWSVVKLLMDRGVSPEHSRKVEDSLLALAAKAGQGDVVRDLLKKGAASDTEQVECALRMAKSASVVWALAEATPKAVRGIPGQWGLLYAAEAGHTEAVVALLEAGVDMKASDSEGITPLHIAAWNGHFEVVRELLVRGADVQSKDGNEDTPLHRAAAGDQLLCVRILLEAGAKKDVVNNKEKTPKDVAVSEIGRRLLDGEGLLYDYTLRNTPKSFSLTSVNSSGPFYLNNLNQSNAPTTGLLFGTTCQSTNSDNSNLNPTNYGQSNVPFGNSGFGNASQVFGNGNSSSFSFGVGQVNAQQGNVFGIPAQSFGNETKTSSPFGCSQVNVSQVSSSGVFGTPAQSDSGKKNTLSNFANANSSQSGVLFGNTKQLFGSENKSSLLTSSEETTTSFGEFPFTNKETKDVTSFSSNTKSVSTGSVFGMSVSSGFSVNNPHQINGPAENNILGISGHSANGLANVFASDMSSPITTSVFGFPAKETNNFPLNNFDPTSASTSTFGKADQSVKKETNESAPINSSQIKSLSGYNIHRNSNKSESDKINSKLDSEEQNKVF